MLLDPYRGPFDVGFERTHLGTTAAHPSVELSACARVARQRRRRPRS